MKTRSIHALFALTLPLAFGLSTSLAYAQDLEDDSPVPASEMNSPAPSADLNEAVDQLSKEQSHPAANNPPAMGRPAPNRAAVPKPDPHGMGKPFAQQAKGKHPKRKPVKIARKTAAAGKGKHAAKKSAKGAKKKHAN